MPMGPNMRISSCRRSCAGRTVEDQGQIGGRRSPLRGAL
jgi:hypothetical protein